MSAQWDFPAFLATPPANARPVPFHEPSPDEETKVQHVVDYFAAEGYVVPEEEGVGEKGGLSEWEMMFLVSGLFGFCMAARKDPPDPICSLN
ncbi:hypothetical protein QFC19_009304 [Naganishia cerealis]|uniref:Uncharacterized protein n=1 Tax=Naganishia cerealis TaxID=610337 RepID=A0ACC2UVX6_9TREE|nr:hypothetical protein QFC19_009304 [Naganishia cerealis]